MEDLVKSKCAKSLKKCLIDYEKILNQIDPEEWQGEFNEAGMFFWNLNKEGEPYVYLKFYNTGLYDIEFTYNTGKNPAYYNQWVDEGTGKTFYKKIDALPENL